MIALGIDGGASSTRWLLTRADGSPVAAGGAGPISGHIFDPAARAAVFATLAEVAAAVRAQAMPDRVVAGVTGLSTGDDVARQLGEAIAARLAIAPERVRVLDDMHIAYRGAFVPGEGILVYAGTGSIAYHLTADGRVERAGGHGFMIDDAGGGFWIGARALRQVLRSREDPGSPPSGALAQLIYRATGGPDWPAIRSFVYGGGRAAVASLAPAVGEAVARDDLDAVDIVNAAGSELAWLAEVMTRRVGRLPVALCGGATSACPTLYAAFAAALPDGVKSRHVTGAPVETAARLAAETPRARSD